jgi:hypothetical protein
MMAERAQQEQMNQASKALGLRITRTGEEIFLVIGKGWRDGPS